MRAVRGCRCVVSVRSVSPVVKTEIRHIWYPIGDGIDIARGPRFGYRFGSRYKTTLHIPASPPGGPPGRETESDPIHPCGVSRTRASDHAITQRPAHQPSRFTLQPPRTTAGARESPRAAGDPLSSHTRPRRVFT